MNQVLEAYSLFKFDENLPDDWVKKVFDDVGFSRYVSFPTEYEVYLDEINICELLNEFYKTLQSWVQMSGVNINTMAVDLNNDEDDCTQSQSQNNEMIWQTLTNEGIDNKPLMCLLGNMILRFLNDKTDSTFFKETLYAIRLYTYMVAIPGSHLCRIFNSTLYSHTVSALKVCCEQLTLPANVDRLQYDKRELMATVHDFLSHIHITLGGKLFKIDEISMDLTIQLLISITQLETVYSTLLSNDLNSLRTDTLSLIAYRGFMILLSLINKLDSDPALSAKNLIKSFVGIFLVTEERTLGLNAKSASIVRSNYIQFLKLILAHAGENAHEAVNILVQKICTIVPDRAEVRQKSANIVIDILKISPFDLQSLIIYAVVYISHMSETKIRLLTLEIINKLLLETNILSSALPPKYAAVTRDEFLLSVILYRCQDMATSVRVKALSYFDQIISAADTNQKVRALITKIFVEPYRGTKVPSEVETYTKDIFDTQQYLLDGKFLDDRSLDTLPGMKVLLDMLLHFSREDKAFVKRCALQVLAKIFLFEKKWINKQLLQTFLIGCGDSSVLIRKSSSQILTDLILMYPDHNDLIVSWVEGVVPMITEEEVKAQEKIMDYFQKVIFSNIVAYNRTTTVILRLPWIIMRLIIDHNKKQFLHYSIGKWIQSNIFKKKIIESIYTHIDNEYNSVTWHLLVSMSQFIDLPTPEIIYNYYEDNNIATGNVGHSQLVMEVLYYVCNLLSRNMKTKLKEQLEKQLKMFAIPLPRIAKARDICEQIIAGGQNTNTPNKNVIEWSNPIISTCLTYVESKIGHAKAPVIVEEPGKLIKVIFLIGELAQVTPTSVSIEHIKILQNLLISPRKREKSVWKGKASNAIKAIVILTVVKLVLQKEEAANTAMPIFREILSSNNVDSTIQVNTIIGICDLCSRYTTLVERYFTCICKCFNSKHEIVRETSLNCVMKRIREEYVKLRPFILFPILTMILDNSDNIRRLVAKFIMVDLKKRNNILENYYSGLFFFLNNCKDHPATVKIPDDLRIVFSFTDRSNDRAYIYTYVLDNLADINRRLVVCKKIIHEVMSPFTNNTLALNEKTENIISDAFKLLIDNEKKITEAISKSKKNQTDDVDEVEESESASQAKRPNLGAAVTETLRMTEAAEILPIITKLRLQLKKKKSICLDHLTTFMCELLRNYRNDMLSLLDGDRDWNAEIEYHFRKAEEHEERRKEESTPSGEEEDPDTQTNDGLLTIAPSPQRVCEQLRSLIISLSRCDDENFRGNGNSGPSQNANDISIIGSSNNSSSKRDTHTDSNDKSSSQNTVINGIVKNLNAELDESISTDKNKMRKKISKNTPDVEQEGNEVNSSSRSVLQDCSPSSSKSSPKKMNFRKDNNKSFTDSKINKKSRGEEKGDTKRCQSKTIDSRKTSESTPNNVNSKKQSGKFLSPDIEMNECERLQKSKRSSSKKQLSPPKEKLLEKTNISNESDDEFIDNAAMDVDEGPIVIGQDRFSSDEDL